MPPRKHARSLTPHPLPNINKAWPSPEERQAELEALLGLKPGELSRAARNQRWLERARLQSERLNAQFETEKK